MFMHPKRCINLGSTRVALLLYSRPTRAGSPDYQLDRWIAQHTPGAQAGIAITGRSRAPGAPAPNGDSLPGQIRRPHARQVPVSSSEVNTMGSRSPHTRQEHPRAHRPGSQASHVGCQRSPHARQVDRQPVEWALTCLTVAPHAPGAPGFLPFISLTPPLSNFAGVCVRLPARSRRRIAPEILTPLPHAPAPGKKDLIRACAREITRAVSPPRRAWIAPRLPQTSRLSILHPHLHGRGQQPALLLPGGR
jgi:hypothetical protein